MNVTDNFFAAASLCVTFYESRYSSNREAPRDAGGGGSRDHDTRDALAHLKSKLDNFVLTLLHTGFSSYLACTCAPANNYRASLFLDEVFPEGRKYHTLVNNAPRHNIQTNLVTGIPQVLLILHGLL